MEKELGNSFFFLETAKGMRMGKVLIITESMIFF